MNLILIIIVGGILGWLASMVMRTDAQQGIFLNIVVGIVGAFLGGLALAPLFHTRLVEGRLASLYDEIAALGAQAVMTGTGPELFETLGPRAQFFEVAETGGLSQVTERTAR